MTSLYKSGSKYKDEVKELLALVSNECGKGIKFYLHIGENGKITAAEVLYLCRPTIMEFTIMNI